MAKKTKSQSDDQSLKELKAHNDGWTNWMQGMGVYGKDQTKGTIYLRDCRLTQNALDAMYFGDGIVKTIVNLVPEMMLSKGFEIEADNELYVKSTLESLGAIDKIIEMLYWARLYGGGLIVMGINDGRPLEMPVDTSQIRSVDFLHVFDRYQCNLVITAENIDQDMRSPNYGQPLFYPIRPYGVTNGNQEIIVHHSRILRVDGIQLPGRVKFQNKGWGESEIQACYSQLVNYASGYNNSAVLISDFVQHVFSIEGLSQKIMCENGRQVMTRFEIMNQAKSNYNMIVKDTLETYEKLSTNVSGIPDLLDRFMMALSAVTRIPVSLLFGRSAAGMNSTGEFDMNSFYDYIIQQQEKKLRPVLEKLIRYVFLSMDGDSNGLEPDNWSLKFNPLTESSPLEEANYRHRVAETDRMYFETGVLTAEEIRNSRFGTGVYSDQTQISETGEELLEFTPEEVELFRNTVEKTSEDKLMDAITKKLIEA